MGQNRIAAVSLDCAEPVPLAEFWASFVGGELAFASAELAVVKLEHLLLTAMRVPGWVPPTWPGEGVGKQGHLDIAVDSMADAQELALSLGATRPDAQPAPERHVVLLDPAGHPFCITSQLPT